MTDSAPQVVEAATSIRSSTLGLGALSWLGALSAYVRSGLWFTVDATELATLAVGLIFTVALRRSPALRSQVPRLNDLRDEEDVGEALQ